jgi:hypothetical protein
MINIHLINGVLVALALVIGTTVALSAVMLLASRVTGQGRAPRGGTRRDLPQQPQPDPDEARELMLV